MSVTVKGYAKINLHLDVVGFLDDGYHSVENVMQSISICDEITVTPIEQNVFSVECDLPDVPSGDGNIATRAARLFFEAINACGGARIEIKKRIPMAAGLAGGSADAAATLVALNLLFNEPLSKEELCAIGAKLGADVPFCIMCGASYSDKRGDELHAFPSLPDGIVIVVACGGEGVSTPWGYRLLDQTFSNFENYIPRGTDGLKTALERGDKYSFCDELFNIFEQPVLSMRPVAAHIRRIMLENGAIKAMMSGSGPSVFGVFADVESAKTVENMLKGEGYFAQVAEPVSAEEARGIKTLIK